MSEAAPELLASQELVYVDVGRKIFKMLRQTVMNYPDTLIAKLLRECPDFGKQEQPLYIDRRPPDVRLDPRNLQVPIGKRILLYITPCFRDGDYEETMPRKSSDRLQRELDFYQLPSLTKLGLLSDSCGLTLSADMASDLMQAIVEEIMKEEMENKFPWCVYIYHQFYKGDVNARRGVYVIPDTVRLIEHRNRIVDFARSTRHINFCASLAERDAFFLPKSSHCPYQYALDGKTTIVLQYPTDALVEMLREEAQRLGLSIEARNLESVKDNAADKNIDLADLPFMYCSFLRKQPDLLK